MSLAGCQINPIDVNFHLQKSLEIFDKNSADKIWSKKDKEIKVSPLMPIRVKWVHALPVNNEITSFLKSQITWYVYDFSRIFQSFESTKSLTPNTPLIQLWCSRSKLNMDEICSLNIHLWYVDIPQKVLLKSLHAH